LGFDLVARVSLLIVVDIQRFLTIADHLISEIEQDLNALPVFTTQQRQVKHEVTV
jgi:hypothetical protein